MKITAPYRDGYYDLRKLCEKVISAKKKLVKLGISWGRIRYNDNLNCFLIFTFIIRLCIKQMHRQAFSWFFLIVKNIVQFPVRQYKYFTDSGRIERKGLRLKSKPNANPLNLCAFYELCISISEWGNWNAKFTPENLATNTDSGKMLAKFIYKLSHLLHVCVCVGQPWTFASGRRRISRKWPNLLVLMNTH